MLYYINIILYYKNIISMFKIYHRSMLWENTGNSKRALEVVEVKVRGNRSPEKRRQGEEHFS